MTAFLFSFRMIYGQRRTFCHFAKILGHRWPNIHYFGAIDNGKVVSTCYAVYIPNLTRSNRGICFIENVITDKDYRKQGLSSQIIEMAISYAKEKRCYKVILQSGIGRTEAHQFYQSVGFNGSSKKGI